MEERIMDKDELRGVKRRRTQDGEDMVDEQSSDALLPDEEFSLEFDGEEYDEGLVGLTPSQLQEELERRERLRAEAHAAAEGCIAAAGEQFAAGAFEEAAESYRSALTYEYDEETECKLFCAITHNYAETDPLLERENAEALSCASEACRTRTLAAMGERLAALRQETEAEAAPLREAVVAGQEARREVFVARRKAALIRFLVALGFVVLFVVGIAVSASFLLRTQSSLPTILVGVFSGLTAVAAVVFLIFSRGLYIWTSLCRANERYSSTEQGALLEELEERLACLALVLDGEEGEN